MGPLPIVSSQRDKKQFYQEQADSQSRKAEQVASQTGNLPEAARLRDVARKSQDAANSIDRQLKNAAE